MSRRRLALCIAAVPLLLSVSFDTDAAKAAFTVSAATVNQPIASDRSHPLWTLAEDAACRWSLGIGRARRADAVAAQSGRAGGRRRRTPPAPRSSRRTMGPKPAAVLAESFDGLGVRFEGPHGLTGSAIRRQQSRGRSRSHRADREHTDGDFHQEGKKYDTTGKVLYGGVPNNTCLHGFTGICEATNNGDTVVRYDQLADRWLIVMPIFRRAAPRPDQPSVEGGPRSGRRRRVWRDSRARPPPCSCRRPRPAATDACRRGRCAASSARHRRRRRSCCGRRQPQTPPQPPPPQGPYAMCYASARRPIQWA
jgi:hypothetical protein